MGFCLIVSLIECEYIGILTELLHARGKSATDFFKIWA